MSQTYFSKSNHPSQNSCVACDYSRNLSLSLREGTMLFGNQKKKSLNVTQTIISADPAGRGDTGDSKTIKTYSSDALFTSFCPLNSSGKS